MKLGIIASLCAAVLLVQFSVAQPADNKPILGVWRAEADGFPFVTLTLTDEGGSLSGAVLFYFHQRKTVNDPYTSTPGLPEPLLNPAFDGQTLTFQVSHRRAHPPGTLSDPPVTFHLKLTGTNSAGVNRGELSNATEHSAGLMMTRSDY